jgi:hypothetical protein
MSSIQPRCGQRTAAADPHALVRRLRASKAGAASWACTCGSQDGAHTPNCRKERRRFDAQKGGLRTLQRYGPSHFRRLRWRQLAGSQS